LPNTGQAWVRTGVLAATVFTPPNAGQAIDMLFQAITKGVQPPERFLSAPSSIPALDQLKPRS